MTRLLAATVAAGLFGFAAVLALSAAHAQQTETGLTPACHVVFTDTLKAEVAQMIVAGIDRLEAVIAAGPPAELPKTDPDADVRAAYNAAFDAAEKHPSCAGAHDQAQLKRIRAGLVAEGKQ